MAAYVIAQMAVHDLDMYRQYAAAVMSTIEPFGGRLVAANAVEVVEGSPQFPRTVIGEFPDMASLKAWYDSPEYQAVINLRRDATNGTLIMVEGLTMPEQPHASKEPVSS